MSSPSVAKVQAEREGRASRRGAAAGAERGGAVAVPPDRRLRVPVGLPHRRARRARRLDRVAVRPRVRRAERVRRAASTARPATSGSRRSASSVPTERIYEPGTNVLVTTWKVPTGWLEVREALVMGPRRGEDTVTPHTRPPTDFDGEHLLVRTARCLSGVVQVELVCEPVFDYGRSPAEWTLENGERAASRSPTGAGQRIGLRTDLPLGIEGGSGAGAPRARRRRRGVLRAVVGGGARRARRRRVRAPRSWPRRRSSGGRGWTRRASPTTAGAGRSSARRWRSRA